MPFFKLMMTTCLLIMGNHESYAFVAPNLSPQTPKCSLSDGRSSSCVAPLCSISDRRSFISSSCVAASTAIAIGSIAPANAIGPVKLSLKPISYFAQPCPPSKPIPGQKAMQGMRGLCVTVEANLDETPPKDLEKVGVYGFVTDGDTGDSVLANNPDLSTDAGQFAMIEAVTTKDKKVSFEFVAAVPKEQDLSIYKEGIGPLNFEGLRLISFPGGQQYGGINPCEMNEFSDECEVWEKENGPYEKGDFMMKSNPRTKGR